MIWFFNGFFVYDRWAKFGDVPSEIANMHNIFQMWTKKKQTKAAWCVYKYVHFLFENIFFICKENTFEYTD